MDRYVLFRTKGDCHPRCGSQSGENHVQRRRVQLCAGVGKTNHRNMGRERGACVVIFLPSPFSSPPSHPVHCGAFLVPDHQVPGKQRDRATAGENKSFFFQPRHGLLNVFNLHFIFLSCVFARFLTCSMSLISF